MKSLSHFLRKSVSKKSIAVPAYLGILLHSIEEQVGQKPTWGFVKFGVLYIALQDHGKKIYIFQNKKSILDEMHKTLQGYGYTIKIKDIRFT